MYPGGTCSSQLWGLQSHTQALAGEPNITPWHRVEISRHLWTKHSQSDALGESEGHRNTSVHSRSWVGHGGGMGRGGLRQTLAPTPRMSGRTPAMMWPPCRMRRVSCPTSQVSPQPGPPSRHPCPCGPWSPRVSGPQLLPWRELEASGEVGPHPLVILLA